MNMKVLFGIGKQLLKSGEAIGLEMKLTEVTEFLAKHPKGIGEEIGLLLKGKGKKAVDVANTLGGFDIATAELNKMAQQYPNAVIKIGAKQSKQGFTVLNATVKNGKKTVLNMAGSVTKDADGLITSFKTRVKTPDGAYTRGFTDKIGKVGVVTQSGNAKTEIKGSLHNLQVNLNNNGKLIAQANVKNSTGKGVAGQKMNMERIDGLTYVDMQSSVMDISAIVDEAKFKEFAKEEAQGIRKLFAKFAPKAKKADGTINAEIKDSKPDDKLPPLVLQILRPLQERFETAIDLFKYNGKKNFERFLSKDEMKTVIEKLRKEGAIAEKEIELAEYPLQVQKAMDYSSQIKSDIRQAEELIRICC